MIIAQPHRMLSVLDAVMENEGLFVLVGVISVLFGLAILVLHPYWRGLSSGFISFLGIIAMARGALILFAPNLARDAAIFIISAPNILPIAGCVLALIGLALFVVSVFSAPSEDLGLI